MRRIGVVVVVVLLFVSSAGIVPSMRGQARAETSQEEIARLKARLVAATARREKLQRAVDELSVALRDRNAQVSKLKAGGKETELRLALVEKQKALVRKRLREKDEEIRRLRRRLKDTGIDPDAGKQDNWGKMLAQLEELIKEERDLIRKLKADPMDKEVRVMLLRQHDTLRRLFIELQVLRRANELPRHEKEAMRVAKEAAEREQKKAEDRLTVAMDEVRRLRAALRARRE